MTEPVVVLDRVRRWFGDHRALEDLSLQVPPGSITVLLGPNGAGKTTAIRIVTGALAPDRGEVRVFGLDPDHDGEAVRRRCGVVSAKPALYDRLSGGDNLRYSAALYGVPRDVTERRVAEAAARFGIDHALDQLVGGYSTGMKTRLALARAVLHDPELLLFDEPTSGLDPESSHAVLSMIREMTGTGATVVMCTHLLLEAEGLADQVVILDGGRDLLSGAQHELTQAYWPRPRVRIAALDLAALDRLDGAQGVLAYRRNGQPEATIEMDDLARVPELVARLAAEGAGVTRVEPFVPTLEDLYFAVRRGRQP